MTPGEIIERERRWAIAAALAAIAAVALFVVSLVILGTTFGGDSNAELLRKVDKDSGTFVLAYVLRAFGSALLAVPLVYLFQAALARSERMRGQLIGLVIAGPIFLAGLAIFTGLSLKDAAPDFVAKAAAQGLGNGEHADDVAQNVINGASLRDVAAGFGFGGALGFALAMTYSCVHAMRVGLLTRFWGSLGAALGVASILFFQFTLLWFLYLGLLIAGWVPGGRPPAWQTGKAMPWPTPGERAAESLQAGEDDGGETGEGETTANSPRQPGERRKRKRRR